MLTILSLQQKEQALQFVWASYQKHPDFTHFVEFSLLLNNFTDSLVHKSQAGLQYACRRLEQQALALLGDENTHPIPKETMTNLGQQVDRLSRLLRHYHSSVHELQQERRVLQQTDVAQKSSVIKKTNQVFLMGEEGLHWQELASQLGYFGISVRQGNWKIPSPDDSDLSVCLVDLGERQPGHWQETLKQLRERLSIAQIICMGIPDDFMSINQALQAGADHCMTQNASLQQILNQVLEHKDEAEQESYRVLIVEDSRTAAYAISRSLEENGITTQALYDPLQSLTVIRQFQPDLILMDMYMPACTGVEVARVIRQHDEFLSIPIVYLSGETNIGLQVEALRLGGDQFLTKPFNPVLVNAVVKSKIDRYRALRRSMQNDSLTGLLNHISTKQALAAALEGVNGGGLAVAMLDIDHFKNVNDTHGHPVGDQVIRSLAWLLKQRLRHSDIIGRYGGEEFVVGLVRAHPKGAQEILDRIREDFSCIVFRGAHDAPFKVTFSVGVAFCTDSQSCNLEMLLEVADSALYQAKHQGRNQVVLAGHAQQAKNKPAPPIAAPILDEPTLVGPNPE
jgi:diguanylate cyclase (GGDEF)-like protein